MYVLYKAIDLTSVLHEILYLTDTQFEWTGVSLISPYCYLQH